MDESQVIKESLRDELSQFDIYLKKSLENNNPRISEILRHAFRVDGKRIRPMLVFLVAKCCGKITPATYHGAVTVELLHMATLMHDDVVDEASTRRGQPSSNAVFDNKRSVLAENGIGGGLSSPGRGLVYNVEDSPPPMPVSTTNVQYLPEIMYCHRPCARV